MLAGGPARGLARHNPGFLTAVAALGGHACGCAGASARAFCEGQLPRSSEASEPSRAALQCIQSSGILLNYIIRIFPLFLFLDF